MPRLAELRTRGARVAIDDFGTGYRSPAHLICPSTCRRSTRSRPVDLPGVTELLARERPAGLIEV